MARIQVGARILSFHKEEEVNANDKQHGGTHYKGQVIQVWDYITANNIPYLEGNAIKYLSRWRYKGGIEDLRKALHYVEKLIELEQERLEEVTRQDCSELVECEHTYDILPDNYGNRAEVCIKCFKIKPAKPEESK